MSKEKCFAYIKDKDGKEKCYCLKELFCKDKECSFYKKRKQAKEEYLEHFNHETQAKIDRNIDRYFRSL